MIWLWLALAWWVGFGVGADYGTTRAALRSGWMQEAGWVASRLGVPATVILRDAIGVACIVVAATTSGPLSAVAALAAFGIGAVGFRVAQGNVRRLWRRHGG